MLKYAHMGTTTLEQDAPAQLRLKVLYFLKIMRHMGNKCASI